jgi:hypothetical protein
MREIAQFLKENPQVLVLLVVCVVLGLGTFLAVVFGLLSSGGGKYGGEPSGSLPVLRAAIGVWGVG